MKNKILEITNYKKNFNLSKNNYIKNVSNLVLATAILAICMTNSVSAATYTSLTERHGADWEWEQSSRSEFVTDTTGGIGYYVYGRTDSYMGVYSDFTNYNPVHQPNYVESQQPTEEFVYNSSYAYSSYTGTTDEDQWYYWNSMYVNQGSDYVYDVTIEELSGALAVGTMVEVIFDYTLAGGVSCGDCAQGSSALAYSELGVWTYDIETDIETLLAEESLSVSAVGGGAVSDENTGMFSVMMAYGEEDMFVSLFTQTIATEAYMTGPDSYSGSSFAWAFADPTISVNLAGYDFGVTKELAGSPLSLPINSVSAVPVPAAIWLFGSGLIGLIGVARRKKV